MPRVALALVTSLHLHGLTPEIAHAVQVPLPRGTHPAPLDHPPLEVCHFSTKSYAVASREVVYEAIRPRSWLSHLSACRIVARGRVREGDSMSPSRLVSPCSSPRYRSSRAVGGAEPFSISDMLPSLK